MMQASYYYSDEDREYVDKLLESFKNGKLGSKFLSEE